MPTYGYKCKACEHTFEVVQKMKDDPIKDCPECKGEVARVLYPVGIVFKGSGFHINDYRKPEKTGDNGHKDEKPKVEPPKPKEEAKTQTTDPEAGSGVSSL